MISNEKKNKYIVVVFQQEHKEQKGQAVMKIDS